MTMCYDIDISYLYPPAVFDDPVKGALLRRNGLHPHSRANYIARFRDARTVRALAGAADDIKAYFQDCGFVFEVSGGALPQGSVDYAFRNHLRDVGKRMQENLAHYDLDARDMNGLDIAACKSAIDEARPIETIGAKCLRFFGKLRRNRFWPYLVHPALALPALTLGVVLALQTLAAPQGTTVSSSLIDANVTFLMPASR